MNEVLTQPASMMAGAAAGNAAAQPILSPAQSFGISDFWAQGDVVSHAVIIMLVVMSILSWTQIVLKTWRATRRNATLAAVENFWRAPTLDNAIHNLSKLDSSSSFAELARQADSAVRHFDIHSARTIGGELDRGEFITRALRQSIVRSTARLESGLTMLASVGSIAPFVGLFGTVWGIYHALIGIASAGLASIDKVSGPVGEALIMTAAGLFVAIPAVLAYNAFTRFNRVELAELDGFAHDLHAYLNTGARMETGAPVKSAPPIRVVEKGKI